MVLRSYSINRTIGLMHLSLCGVAVLLALLFPVQVSAQLPSLESAPETLPESKIREWVESVASAPELGQDAQRLLDRLDVSIEEDGTIQTRNWVVTKVLTQQGVQNFIRQRTIWSPWKQSRPQVQIRILQPDGTTVNIDDSSAIEQSAASDPQSALVDDTRQLIILLNGLRVGSVVELIETQELKLTIEESTYASFALAPMQDTHLFQLRVESKGEVPFRWDTAGWEVTPKLVSSDAIDGTARLIGFEELDASSLVQRYEVHTGPDIASYPLLRVARGHSWQSVASEYHAMVAPIIDQSQAIAEQLTAGFDKESSDGEKIEFCLKRLQETVVYTGIEFGGNRILPYSASEIISRGFGDCKDQSMLLTAMLRSQGVNSNLVLVSVGTDLDVWPEAKSLSAFDHAIVQADLGDHSIWMDPTAVGYPPGQLPAACANRRALVIHPDTKTLSHTPKTDTNRSQTTHQLHYQIDGTGFGSQEVKRIYSGDRALEIAALVGASLDSPSLPSLVTQAYQADPSQTSVESNPNTHELTITFKGPKRQLTEYEYGNSSFQLDVSGVVDELPMLLWPRENLADGLSIEAGNDSRLQPFQLRTPAKTQIVSHFDFPTYLKCDVRTGVLQADFGPVNLRVEVDQVVRLNDKYSRLSVRSEVTASASDTPIPASEVLEIRERLIPWLAPDSPFFIPVSLFDAAFENTSTPEERASTVMTLLDRRETYPDSAAVYDSLATALIYCGAYNLARETASKAIELGPDQPIVLGSCGNLLQIGDNGRPWSPGHQHDAVRTVLERLRSIEPQKPANEILDNSGVDVIDLNGFSSDDLDSIRAAANECRQLLTMGLLSDARADTAVVRTINLLFRAREDAQLSEFVRQYNLQSVVEGSPLEWVVNKYQGASLLAFLDRFRAQQPNGEETENEFALHAFVFLLCQYGRQDLIPAFKNSLADAGFDVSEVPTYEPFFQQPSNPKDRDATRPDAATVIRTGLARFLTKSSGDYYFLEESQRTQINYQPPFASGLVRVAGGMFTSWSPAGLRDYLNRVPATTTETTWGAQTIELQALGYHLRDLIVAVPNDEPPGYRWFFRFDHRAHIQWCRHLLETGNREQLRHAIDALVQNQDELQWFDQFSGSAGARAWVRLQSSDQLELALAVFAAEFRIANDADRELIEQAIEDESVRTIRVQLLRSLNAHHFTRLDLDGVFKVSGELVKSAPNYLRHWINVFSAAQWNGFEVEALELVQSLKESQLPAVQHFCDAHVALLEGNYMEAIELAKAPEITEDVRARLVNTIAWRSLSSPKMKDIRQPALEFLQNTSEVDTNPVYLHTVVCLAAILGDIETALAEFNRMNEIGGVTRASRLFAEACIARGMNKVDLSETLFEQAASESSSSDLILSIRAMTN